MKRITPGSIIGFAALALWLAGCTDQHAPSGGPAAGSAPLAVTATCADPSASEGDGWICPESTTVDCSELDELPAIVVASPEGTQCDPDELIVSDPGVLTAGAHTLSVRNQAGATLCTTAVEVVDDTPPVIQTHVLNLWPPNHKFHDIAVEDCVSVVDACDGTLRGEFIWASSDEPVDDIGDGHHSPDILLSDDCQHVSLRSERQGPKDGRVYKLGVRVVDTAGNVTDGECSVVVDHDQRGVLGADSGEAYRVTFDGTSGGLTCDGEPDAPPNPPVTPPNPPVTPAPDNPE